MAASGTRTIHSNWVSCLRTRPWKETQNTDEPLDINCGISALAALGHHFEQMAFFFLSFWARSRSSQQLPLRVFLHQLFLYHHPYLYYSWHTLNLAYI